MDRPEIPHFDGCESRLEAVTNELITAVRRYAEQGEADTFTDGEQEAAAYRGLMDKLVHVRLARG